MSLHYVIDGYNVIKHPAFIKANRETSDERLALLQVIRYKKLTGSPNNSVTVVFDGYPDTRGPSVNDTGIKVIFSREDSADLKIKKIVEDSTGRRNVVVVSDDREIKIFVKSIGALALGVGEFMGSNRKPANLEKEPLKQELTYTQMHKINQELRKLWLK